MSIFSLSSQTSLEQDISIGACLLGRILSELSTNIPGKKYFQWHWAHDIMSRKVDSMNTKYFYERRPWNRQEEQKNSLKL